MSRVPCSLTRTAPPLGHLTMGSPGPGPGPHTQHLYGGSQTEREGGGCLETGNNTTCTGSPWPTEGQAMSSLWSLQPKNIKPKDKSQFHVVIVQFLYTAL